MRLKRRRSKVPVVPLTSFGDIAFLLIIFFVLASVFMRESHITVVPARSPDLERVEPVISVILDKDGELWLQGSPCPPDALEPAIAALVGDSKDRTVMVKIDKDQVQSDFNRVLVALGGAGADVVLLGEKEGQ